MFDVILSPDAQVFYEAADAPLVRKLNRCFASLEKNPRTDGSVKRLKGEWSGYWRYRVGDWRVIYRIDDPVQQVNVLVIAHRREVYE
jgi:mRNA interferase RelE/StbE